MILISTETVFMERLAQFHDKFGYPLLLVVCLTLAWAADPGSRKQVGLPQSDVRLSLVNGILHYNDELFTGYIYELGPATDTLYKAGYRHGLTHGAERRWFSKGRLAEERFFAYGIKTGTHLAWWENGNTRFEYQFKEGEHHGSAKEWFPNGKLLRFFHYNRGYEEGRQQMWWEDGRVRANYFVKDGQRFGLLGQKLCINNIK